LAVQIRAEHLTVAYYADIYVLRDVTVEAPEGLISCVIGPNGAGKSTLLKTLFGYLRPKQGRVVFDGEEVTDLQAQERMRRGVGYVDQAHSVFPGMTVEENLELGGWTFRKDRRGIEESKERIYSHYPVLAHRRQVNAGALSGGEQRMLEIARILMPDPTVVLLDEPSAGLAPKVAREVYGEVGRLKDLGKTVMLVDQNINQAVSCSDYLYVMDLGRVRSEGFVDHLGEDLRKIVSSWLSGV
jgi:branched-chain amino acid transport system ATP-binding protein